MRLRSIQTVMSLGSVDIPKELNQSFLAPNIDLIKSISPNKWKVVQVEIDILYIWT